MNVIHFPSICIILVVIEVYDKSLNVIWIVAQGAWNIYVVERDQMSSYTYTRFIIFFKH